MDSDELTKNLYTVDDESKAFLQNISDLNPKQKIIEIEKYVRQKAYYDYKNKEVMNLKK